VEYENLSLEELHAKLEETAEAQAAIEQLVAQRKEQAKGELAQEIRDLIAERGYAVEDIAELLQKGRRRKKADAQAKGAGRYACYVVPERKPRSFLKIRRPHCTDAVRFIHYGTIGTESCHLLSPIRDGAAEWTRQPLGAIFWPTRRVRPRAAAGIARPRPVRPTGGRRGGAGCVRPRPVRRSA